MMSLRSVITQATRGGKCRRTLPSSSDPKVLTTALTWFKALKEAATQRVYLMVKNSCDIDINRKSAERLTRFMNWQEEKKRGFSYVSTKFVRYNPGNPKSLHLAAAHFAETYTPTGLALILTSAGLGFNTMLTSYHNAKTNAKIEVMEKSLGEHISSFENFCGKLELLEDEVEKKNQAEERLTTELKKIHAQLETLKKQK